MIITNQSEKSSEEQALPGHNRWHPEIPPVTSVVPGECFRVECPDMMDGQIKNDDDASDIRDLDMSRAHMISGPIHVEGSEPGDMLVVDILDINSLRGREWGYTGILPPEMGGILSDHFPDPRKAIWDFEGVYAVSRHIPGVRFAGQIHPGIIGVAPSHEMLAKWNAREQALINAHPDATPQPASPPTPEGAVLGTLDDSKWDRVAHEAARTLPGRENGGNCDIRNMSRGSRLYLPVFVPGANLSVGDIHFSLADGEITICGAIEMAGVLDLKVDLIRNGVERFGLNNPFFQPGPVEPQYSDQIIFEGFSIEDDGDQYHLNPYVSYRQACLEGIAYLTRFGYSAEQAYIILTTAPVEGRISAMGGKPNAVCTLALPTGIFEGDIHPFAETGWMRPEGGDLARVQG